MNEIEEKEMYKLGRRSKEQKIKDWERGKAYNELKVICKCGKRIPMSVREEEVTCHWCNRKVKNTSKARFKYVMMEKLKKEGE